jgi:hypothetical protein
MCRAFAAFTSTGLHRRRLSPFYATHRALWARLHPRASLSRRTGGVSSASTSAYARRAKSNDGVKTMGQKWKCQINVFRHRVEVSSYFLNHLAVIAFGIDRLVIVRVLNYHSRVPSTVLTGTS